MPSQKRNRMLPYRNRKHNIRPIPEPKGQVCTPEVRSHPQPNLPVSHSSAATLLRKSKPFPFFKLPGEIRNKIYDLVVPQSRVVISGSHPQKELDKLKLANPLKKHKCPRYRLLGKFTKNPTSVSLLLTCRRMNQEAVQFIYTRTTFCFDRIVTINKFFNIAPSAGIRAIENLEITHRGYGEPQWMDDRVWKFKHDAKWRMTLERVKQQMVALRRLSINLTFFDWPCRLETSERWARPLLSLAGTGLEWVDVTLEHDRFHPAKVMAAAKSLESAMMTMEGRKSKAKQKEIPRELSNVLTIRLPLDSKSTNAAKPIKKVVKSKGLEQYARFEPPVAYC